MQLPFLRQYNRYQHDQESQFPTNLCRRRYRNHQSRQNCQSHWTHHYRHHSAVPAEGQVQVQVRSAAQEPEQQAPDYWAVPA